jgi:hypothetical protein
VTQYLTQAFCLVVVASACSSSSSAGKHGTGSGGASGSSATPQSTSTTSTSSSDAGGGPSSGGRSGNGGTNASSGQGGVGGHGSSGAGGNTSTGGQGDASGMVSTGSPDAGNGQGGDSGAQGTGGRGAPDGGGDGGPAIRVPSCTNGPHEQCSTLTCGPGQLCVWVVFDCGALEGSTAQCVPDPCHGSALDCATCAGTICKSLNPPRNFSCSLSITNPQSIDCSGGGVCASPETRISTPAGEIPIKDLRQGDLVYSKTASGTVVVPLLAVTRRAVHDHAVVHMVFTDGAELFVSGPHPTADGRRLSDLRPGDLLDGRQVLTANYEPYPYDSTYDILPASKTGAYVANGVWLGSTLARQQ